MKTVKAIRCVPVYHFDDLEEHAKEKARAWWRNASSGDNYLTEEMVDSLKGACKALFWKLEDYCISACGHSFVEIDAPSTEVNRPYGLDEALPMRGVRLWKWMLGENYDGTVGPEGSCPFTGVCFDEDFLDPLRAFLKRPDTESTLQDIVDSCAHSWLSSAISNLDYADSDEAVDDNIRCNEYEFLEDGRLA